MFGVDEDLDLDAIEARAKAAIEGPWEAVHDDSGEVSIRIEGEDPGFYTEIARTTQWPDDLDRSPTADFIAASRTDVLALVAEVRRLSGVLSDWVVL